MIDAFERPDIRVVQSARPRNAKMISIIRPSDEIGSARSHGRATVKLRHHLIRIAAYYNAKRSALTDSISTEFAYKICVALLNAPSEQHHAIIATLNAEKAAKISIAHTDMRREEQTVKTVTVQSLKRYNNNQLGRRRRPKRPNPKSSLRFSALRR